MLAALKTPFKPSLSGRLLVICAGGFDAARKPETVVFK
jgi:hypothetical protein